MDTGTIIYIITMGWTLIIFGGLTYLIVKKKDYFLISGFYKRSEEEKVYLQKSGYLNAMAKAMTISFWIFTLTFIVGLLPIPYGFEIGIGIFLIVLLGGMIWIQRYEVPYRRKRATWTTAIISIVTLGFIIAIFVVGYIDNEIKVNQDIFEITGMYGLELDIDDIEHITLLDELPEVIMKTNGFATTNLLKGRFQLVEPYGTCTLFIQKRTNPVLYIQTKDDYVMIARKDANETRVLHDLLIQEKNRLANNESYE
ncbi:MAG TPA: DUF3784 domain-containing protein [Cerasibacillus sp.]|uniref:DUF3784 domain-containing protein n=1 Tax=Cerasibacillus sp. TaxID=2498711 RepID=UPI002F3ECCC8